MGWIGVRIGLELGSVGYSLVGLGSYHLKNCRLGLIVFGWAELSWVQLNSVGLDLDGFCMGSCWVQLISVGLDLGSGWVQLN